MIWLLWKKSSENSKILKEESLALKKTRDKLRAEREAAMDELLHSTLLGGTVDG